MGDRPLGPLGIDPLHFSLTICALLLLFVLYLLLPKGLRVHHFRAYPKRYAWAARPRSRRSRSSSNGGNGQVSSSGVSPLISTSPGVAPSSSSFLHSPNSASRPPPTAYNMSSAISEAGTSSYSVGTRRGHGNPFAGGPMDTDGIYSESGRSQMSNNLRHGLLDLNSNDEIVISAAMQQLRDAGVLIVAHGSRGKPKTVRLQLTDNSITWRTETRKKLPNGSYTSKLGKLHSVSLSNIMYVDVGKQTTALRRVENASVPESLCFSLLTKEGSLDLEANSPRERDALVSCFSLVLDEVHAQNWRDIYRGGSSEMPSSFDEYDAHDTGNSNQPRGSNRV